ncbi:MAG: pyridoxal 5'-phosphate synthase glutaminase subunit PdxT [Candidatus Zixiibacteriota bacterium]|nr:MAG: pyridoxal 5'-phosphate synthase glutaminase subunit PdxT [candidate division Zixibacteria bacterium]
MGILVGVLAIQGDFKAHIKVFKKLGVAHKEIRSENDLSGVTHLVVPGGESTTIRKVAKSEGFWNKLAIFRGPVLGTCMGSVLMARQIESPKAEGWGMLDITAKRNAYGRQINSFTAEGKIAISEKPFEMVFIRAPKFVRVGDKVEPIAWLGDEATGVISGNKMALAFHPELTDNGCFHEYFLGL